MNKILINLGIIGILVFAFIAIFPYVNGGKSITQAALFSDRGSSGSKLKPNWTQNRKQENREAERIQNLSTYLARFCAAGKFPVDIYIWCEENRTFATVYKNANNKECRKKGVAPVRIIVSDKDVKTGSFVNGHFVIRYHYVNCPYKSAPKTYNI